jgi:phosphatidate cytidylyltransferase
LSRQLRDAGDLTAPGAASGSAPPAPRDRTSPWALRLRIVSGVVFVPLLILLLRAGGWAFLAFVVLEVSLGLVEFYRMMRGHGYAPYRRLGLLAGFGLLWATYRPQTPHLELLVTSLLVLTLALELRQPAAKRRVGDIAVTLFGILYVGWLSAHLVMLRELPWRAGTAYAEGASYAGLAFFITWSCDTGAYGVGRWLGRNRPWASISPRKSLEGAFGGFLFAVAAAFVARAWFAPYLSVVDAAVLGVLVGIFAQVGDLVESLLKRDAEHGDSSDVIPGHGGILDRFDSLYFGAPAVFYYLKTVVFGVP